MSINEGNIRLIESSLSRVWQHINNPNTTFGVVSAYRQDLFSEEQNLERHEELRKTIRGLHYGYIEQRSGYSYKDIDTGELGIREEKSFFIPNIDFGDILYLGKKFDQESVLFKDEAGFGLFLCKNGKEDMRFKSHNDLYSFKPKDVEIAYSQLISANQNQKVKFSYIAEHHIANNTDGYKAMQSHKIAENYWACMTDLYHL